MLKLEELAKQKFYDLKKKWGKVVSAKGDKYKTKYDSIVAESDEASPHSLRLMESISLSYDDGFREETGHMFVNQEGKAYFKLDSWERDILDEERRRPDFICWIRNQPNKGWALCIEYKMDGKPMAFYPDFIIIRKENDSYVADLLEPHNSKYNDNYAKTTGLCDYLKEEKGIGRAEIIRKEGNRYLRLDVGNGMVQHDIMGIRNDEELNHLFRKYNLD